MQKVLVVAAHPDDEILGCGGTLAKHKAAGDEIQVIFMTNGVSARASQTGLGSVVSAAVEVNSGQLALEDNRAEIIDRQLIQRRQAALDAVAWVTDRPPVFLDLPDNRMDSLALLDIVQPLEQMIFSFAPEIIYTHCHVDLNVDHRLTHQAVMTACRPVPGSSVKKILAFEVRSSTEWQSPHYGLFAPNYFVDISAHWPTKQAALKAYAEEMRPAPHSRSIELLEAQARLRGGSLGVEYAEAFMVERILV